MSFIQVIPLFTPTDGEGRIQQWFTEADVRKELDAMPAVVALYQSVLDGNVDEIRRAVESPTLGGVKWSDLPCLWLRDTKTAVALPLPANSRDDFIKVFRRLSDAISRGASVAQIAQQFGANPAGVRPQLILLVHGIRTRAEWQDMVAAALERPGVTTVVPLKYGFFDAFHFWRPDEGSRRRAIEELRWRVKDAVQQHPGSELIIIAHSFGTYAVLDILRDEPALVPNRMIFCGAVVSTKFRWDTLKNRPALIVNECGAKDIWPVLAQSGSWGYGASGAFGFGVAGIRDRYHEGGHSQYFNREFVDQYWRPWVHDEVYERSKFDVARPPAPWWMSVLPYVPLKWVVLALFVLILWVSWHGASWALGRFGPGKNGGDDRPEKGTAVVRQDDQKKASRYWVTFEQLDMDGEPIKPLSKTFTQRSEKEAVGDLSNLLDQTALSSLRVKITRDGAITSEPKDERLRKFLWIVSGGRKEHVPFPISEAVDRRLSGKKPGDAPPPSRTSVSDPSKAMLEQALRNRDQQPMYLLLARPGFELWLDEWPESERQIDLTPVKPILVVQSRDEKSRPAAIAVADALKRESWDVRSENADWKPPAHPKLRSEGALLLDAQIQIKILDLKRSRIDYWVKVETAND